MNIEKKYCTAFKRYNEKRDGVFDSIEIHSIGCAQNTALMIRNNMNKYSPDGIVHACVDAETAGYIIEMLPDTNICWADGGYGNHHSYCIEIAESDYMKYYPNSASFSITDSTKFIADIKRGYETAVSYVAKKCKEFGFNPLKKLSNGLYQVYSHQEANAKGLATAHVDPTHIWCKISKTMDTFRNDVAKSMNATTSTETDTPNTDKIWMGWTKRESGTVGFRQTNGDSGNAFGKYQFDRRYALVPFMQFCRKYSASHYSVFDNYISLGAGSERLKGNTGLASTWLSLCDKYPEEFEKLQDIYGYQYYYMEAKRYIMNLYSIDMNDHSPAVKGTLYSMAIRSGSLTGARKFAGCNNKTGDKTMLNTSYATYGGADCSRWTKAGQWGDALAALDAGTYTAVPTELPTYNIEPDTDEPWYRVRKKWSDSKTQNGAYHNLQKAKACADANPGYKVYDESGKCVHEPKNTFKAYEVKVKITDLRIREKPSLSGKDKGYIKPGIYHIVSETEADGYTWGELKSGAGYIALEHVTKI